MLHSYITTQSERDKDAQRKRRRRPLGFFLLCCCVACGLVAVAAVIVLSLIPLYLTSPAVQIVDDADDSEMISTELITEYELPMDTELSELDITNKDELTEQFNKALHLERGILSVYTATISPRSSRVIHGGRRRRLVSCDSADALAVGARVHIRLKIKYPRRCRGNAACKAKILKDCKTRLENAETITASITVGIKKLVITITIRICSVNVEPKGTKTTTTISATTPSVAATTPTAEITTTSTQAADKDTTTVTDIPIKTSTVMINTATPTPGATGTSTSAATTKTVTTSTPTTATTTRTITTTARTTTTTLPSSSTAACYDSIDYYEPVTGHTCQTYIDYGFCNGSSVVANAGIDATLAQVNCCFCGKGTASKTG